MEDIALKRLQKEKRDWKINRPFVNKKTKSIGILCSFSKKR